MLFVFAININLSMPNVTFNRSKRSWEEAQPLLGHDMDKFRDRSDERSTARQVNISNTYIKSINNIYKMNIITLY